MYPGVLGSDGHLFHIILQKREPLPIGSKDLFITVVSLHGLVPRSLGGSNGVCKSYAPTHVT